jgi:hypothetical protein
LHSVGLLVSVAAMVIGALKHSDDEN